MLKSNPTHYVGFFYINLWDFFASLKQIAKIPAKNRKIAKQHTKKRKETTKKD